MWHVLIEMILAFISFVVCLQKLIFEHLSTTFAGWKTNAFTLQTPLAT